MVTYDIALLDATLVEQEFYAVLMSDCVPYCFLCHDLQAVDSLSCLDEQHHSPWLLQLLDELPETCLALDHHLEVNQPTGCCVRRR